MALGRPLADYATTFRKITRELGVGKRVQITGPEIADLVGEPAGRVQRVLDVMRRAGALELDWEFRTGQKGRLPVYIVLSDDLAWTEQKMADKGIRWSAKQEQTSNAPTGPGKPQNSVVRSFSDLSPMRKSEPRAELEVARKYRDQQTFIAEQRERFREMGLVMPEPSAMYDEMRIVELTAIVRILPYVESLEKSNANLTEQNNTIRAPMGELNDLRSKVRSQTEHIERLVAEKAGIKDDVQKMVDDHRREVRDLKDQIEALEGQLRAARGNKAINGAIAVTEIQKDLAAG